MLMEQITRIKPTDHAKQTKLSHMDQCSTRQTASKKKDDTPWCSVVETQELTDGFLEMVVDHINIRFGKYQGS